MAIALRASTTVTSATRTNTTVNAPAGAVNGSDVIWVAINAGGPSSVTISTPTGWALWQSATYSASDPWTVNMYVFVRVHNGATSWTFNHASAATDAWCGAWSGVDTTTPSDCTPAVANAPINGYGSSNNPGSIASITIATAGAQEIVARGSWDGNAITPPTGWTEELDQAITWVGDKSAASSGATGTTTLGTGNTNYGGAGNYGPWASIHTALRPASSGTSYSLNVPAGVITANGTAPAISVGVGRTITVPAGVVTNTATAPAVSLGRNTAVPAGQVTASATAPAILVGSGATVTVSAGSVTAAGTAPSVSAAATTAVPAGAILAAATAPTLTTGGGASVTVPAGAITASATAPIVSVGVGVTIAVPAGQITASSTAPAVSTGSGATVTVPAGTITANATAPSVSVGSGATIAVPAGQITLTGKAPTVTVGGAYNLAVPAGVISHNGTAPAVSLGFGVAVPAGIINLTATAPVLSITGGVNITPPAGLITLTSTAPTVSAGAVAAVPAGAMTMAGTAPFVLMGVAVRPLILSAGTLRSDDIGGTITYQIGGGTLS